MDQAEPISMRKPLRLMVIGWEILVGFDEDCWKMKITDYGMWSPPYGTFREALQDAIKKVEGFAL